MRLHWALTERTSRISLPVLAPDSSLRLTDQLDTDYESTDATNELRCRVAKPACSVLTTQAYAGATLHSWRACSKCYHLA